MMTTVPASSTPPSALAVWTRAARPKTLWAAFAPVLVGVALALDAGVAHPLSAVLALAGALLIQVGTNLYNDYADFQKGADTEARQGPLRVTQAGWVTPGAMLRATVVVFTLAVAAGGYLMWRGGWPIILIGVLSILFGILYTAGRYALAYLGIADLFVLVFFGPVAVGGTYYVQALHVTPVVLAAGLAPGLIAVALLLTNNIRDVEEDAAAGKKTLVVRLGRRAAVVLYGICVVTAICLPVVLFLATGSHPLAMATLVLLPMAAGMIRRVALTHGVALNPLLGATSRLLLHYSLIFSIGWNL